MMQLIPHPQKNTWQQLLQRPGQNFDALLPVVETIIETVRQQGDAALKNYTAQFDKVSLPQLALTETEWQAADNISEALKTAIQTAIGNITRFHEAQREVFAPVHTMPGVQCWRKSVAIEKAGLYIPGGTAPLFSTLLMLAIPAKLAGCKEIVLCTPPDSEGLIHPAILYAAQQTGVTQLFKVGGAQAIAAMAYGTESIPAVSKIFGPGNRYVTAAKMWLSARGMAIDMPAGPSEVAILADSSANPAFVAADLLSQAEHGPDSQVLLVSDDAAMLQEINKALQQQMTLLPRAGFATRALENSKAILVGSLEDGMELLNDYAAEHLIIATNEPEIWAAKVINAGSVFLGHYTPESAGDYASGTNHTLPTNGYAKAYSGVSLDSFVKKITFQHITKEGIQQISDTVITMAEAEGLDAHARAVSIRLVEPENAGAKY
jgi:histidinol dehydrogenase